MTADSTATCEIAGGHRPPLQLLESSLLRHRYAACSNLKKLGFILLPKTHGITEARQGCFAFHGHSHCRRNLFLEGARVDQRIPAVSVAWTGRVLRADSNVSRSSHPLDHGRQL